MSRLLDIILLVFCHSVISCCFIRSYSTGPCCQDVLDLVAKHLCCVHVYTVCRQPLLHWACSGVDDDPHRETPDTTCVLNPVSWHHSRPPRWYHSRPPRWHHSRPPPQRCGRLRCLGEIELFHERLWSQHWWPPPRRSRGRPERSRECRRR